MGMDAHTSAVTVIVVVDDTLYTASTDKTVKHSTLAGEPLRIYFGAIDSVRCCAVNDGTVVAGIREGSLAFWEGENKEPILYGAHTSIVSCLVFTTNDDGQPCLVSASYDQ